jgi:outer membrane receptor protein involved in Fe transport
MKKLLRSIPVILLLLLISASMIWSGTTGKIAGTITDKETGEPLLGANIIVEGMNLGAATDLKGHYTILEVPPGTYRLQISYIGYRSIKVNDVHVNIDQTARVDMSLQSQAVNSGEVVVVAERKLIKPDVATSVVAISTSQIQELPISNVVSALGLQAGVQGGWGGMLVSANAPSYANTYGQYGGRGNISVGSSQGSGVTIRGGGGEKILFNVDGVTMRDPRNDEPDTRIALSSVKEVSIERGGFNAEYGQVSAGVINVVTHSGSKSEYSVRFQTRIAPPQPKYWLAPGVVDLNNTNSYALRPYFDPAVAWTGTGNGNWDYYTQSKYPSFVGWNAISQSMNAAGYNLTPAACQRVFEYEIRKAEPNNQPDYDIDAGLGGPLPFVSSMLGDARFYASYRSRRSMLLWPLSRPDYRDYDGTFQLNTNISPAMKLQLSGMYGQTYTELNDRAGNSFLGSYNYLNTSQDIANQTYMGSYVDLFTLWSDFNFNLTDIWHRSLSAKFTHTLNSSTYYEVLVQNYTVNYNTRPGALRDTTQKFEIVPGFYEDSNPFGYTPYNYSNAVLINGSSFIAVARDNSIVSTTAVKADITSQIDFNNLIKAGLSFNYNNLNFDYGTLSGQTHTWFSHTTEHVFPFQGAGYVQDKLETKEFTMNLGLRLDYNDANVHWWNIDPFDPSFFSSTYDSAKSFPTTPSKMQWYLSPRLGISHPITENAKLFFNYGWFRQLPQYESAFYLGRNTLHQMTDFGNPNLIMSKTISYELGVDYSLGDEYLFQVAGYYNDVSDQQDVVHYIASTGYDYYATSANSYEDRKGFEITFRKTSGNWITGMLNYTYQINTTGHFNESEVFNDVSAQLDFNHATQNLYQNRPIPQPFARANINLFTPADFGPELIGNHILGDWMLNVVMDWQAGFWTTWDPNGILNIAYNVQAVDFFNTYFRLQKNLNLGKVSLQLFMDVNNVFNTHRLWYSGNDYVSYMSSLHLPISNAYPNIPGSDKVGDYRKPGDAWQPMEQISVIDLARPPASNQTSAIYYEMSSGKYWQYTNGVWGLVSQSKIDQVLKNKDYINMPEESTFWFLDPRNYFFGLTVSFNLSN